MTNEMARLAGYRRPMICIVMSENGGVWLANTKRTDVGLSLKLACESHAVARNPGTMAQSALRVWVDDDTRGYFISAWDTTKRWRVLPKTVQKCMRVLISHVGSPLWMSRRRQPSLSVWMFFRCWARAPLLQCVALFTSYGLDKNTTCTETARTSEIHL